MEQRGWGDWLEFERFCYASPHPLGLAVAMFIDNRIVMRMWSWLQIDQAADFDLAVQRHVLNVRRAAEKRQEQLLEQRFPSSLTR